MSYKSKLAIATFAVLITIALLSLTSAYCSNDNYGVYTSAYYQLDGYGCNNYHNYYQLNDYSDYSYSSRHDNYGDSYPIYLAFYGNAYPPTTNSHLIYYNYGYNGHDLGRYDYRKHILSTNVLVNDYLSNDYLNNWHLRIYR
jgi:hypothetical protein